MFKNECCIKCNTVLKGDELRNCSNCMKLCIVGDCNGKIHKNYEYCEDHSPEKLKDEILGNNSEDESDDTDEE